MLRLIFLFTVLPIVELWLMIEVGSQIGVASTLGICVLTGVIGAWLARSQGAAVLQRMQSTIQQGGLPAREILDGVLILVAGVVLLTPGFVTDAIGLFLLLPPTRALVRMYLARVMKAKLASGQWTATQAGAASGLGPDGSFFHARWTSTGGARPDAERQTREAVSGQEVLEPERAPRPPHPKPPEIIDVR